MKKIILFLFILILFFPKILALCNEGQIDINGASIEELDKLSGIGPVKAQAIIDTRPFSSVDDLIRVYGIGNKTLADIKTQGLACVGDEQIQEENKPDEQVFENETNKVAENEEEPSEIIEINTQKNVTAQVINLNADSKNIKSNNIKELNKSKLAGYCLVTFCLLIVALFMLKKNRYKKNEFR